jgi:hypothetical protein
VVIEKADSIVEHPNFRHAENIKVALSGLF